MNPPPPQKNPPFVFFSQKNEFSEFNFIEKTKFSNVIPPLKISWWDGGWYVDGGCRAGGLMRLEMSEGLDQTTNLALSLAELGTASPSTRFVITQNSFDNLYHYKSKQF